MTRLLSPQPLALFARSEGQRIAFSPGRWQLWVDYAGVEADETLTSPDDADVIIAAHSFQNLRCAMIKIVDDDPRFA
jgi:hypothetical protein